MKKMMPAFLMALAAMTAAATAQTTFNHMGILPGANSSWAYAVSADGSVIAGRSGTNFYYGGSTHAVQWTSSGGLLDLDPLVNDSAAWGISGDGIVMAGRGLSGSRGYRAFTWTAAGAIDHAFQGGELFGVSFDGTVSVGDQTDNAGTHAVRYSNSRTTRLDLDAGAFSSIAYGTNASGSIIVGIASLPSVGTRAFRWTESGGLVNLGQQTPGGISGAKGISSDGSTIVGYTTILNRAHAWRWVGSTQTDMSLLADSTPLTSTAQAASSDGSTIVGSASWNGTTNHAFVWRADTGMLDLNDVMRQTLPAGWTLSDAYGVSANGQVIVGGGINPSGVPEGWIIGVPSCISPILKGQPQSASTHEGEDVHFTVAAAGSGPFTYTWYHNAQIISGANGHDLEVFPVTADSAGKYQCQVSNGCGSVMSAECDLSVNHCHGDFNDDGGIDGSDIDGFFAAWESGDSSADINADGGVDGDDVGSFMGHWEGGC
ncbi:MAG: immunoglobulin domain-containing protein [Planctomycetota bacterium]|nr:immunoglobulin domain-containing protein [Planctomycetota bacterium]